MPAIFPRDFPPRIFRAIFPREFSPRIFPAILLGKCAAVAMKMVLTATVILHDVWTMCWTPCDRRHPAASEGHFMDMHDGRQGTYLCVGLAGSCGTLGLTQSAFWFGLTARSIDLGIAFGDFGPLLVPQRDYLSRVEQSESVKANG